MTRRRTRKTLSHLDGLDPDQIRALLDRLLATHAELGAEAQQIADELLSRVSEDEIARRVEGAVRACDVDLLCARSGKTEHGYESPYDLAGEVLEASVEPFMTMLDERHALGRHDDARTICQGVVRGLYELRGGGDTTDTVLGFFPDFPGEAAADAVERYVEGLPRPGRKRSRAKPVFTSAFMKKVLAWGEWLERILTGP
jgi:hypothetical protein